VRCISARQLLNTRLYICPSLATQHTNNIIDNYRRCVNFYSIKLFCCSQGPWRNKLGLRAERTDNCPSVIRGPFYTPTKCYLQSRQYCKQPSMSSFLKWCLPFRFLKYCHYLISCGAATQRGPWLPHSRGFYITHNDTPQSVGLL